jgi:hypothetical protein
MLKISTKIEPYYSINYPIIQWKINNKQDINYTDVIAYGNNEKNYGYIANSKKNLKYWELVLSSVFKEKIFLCREQGKGEDSFFFNGIARFFPKGNRIFVEVRKGCNLATFIKYKKIFKNFNVTLAGNYNLICIEKLNI